jgi:hypothetical protein
LLRVFFEASFDHILRETQPIDRAKATGFPESLDF